MTPITLHKSTGEERVVIAENIVMIQPLTGQYEYGSHIKFTGLSSGIDVRESPQDIARLIRESR